MMDAELKLRFLNVGYGEAMLLTAPDAKGGRFTMLIDGGSAEDAEYAGFPQRAPAAKQLAELGITRLHVLLNTHIHEDHTCGLSEILKHTEIDEYWCCDLPEACAAWSSLSSELTQHGCSDKFVRALNAHRELLGALHARGVPVHMLRQGTFEPERTLAPGLTVSVLGPTREESASMRTLLTDIYVAHSLDEQASLVQQADAAMNNHSVMLMLSYYNTRILLPGDTNKAGYGHLAPEALQADIFKLGHHGQRDSVDKALARAVSPRVAVVCASSDRRYDSMHPDTLSGLAATGSVDAPVRFLLSDVPALPPWTDGVPAHRVSEITIQRDGEISLRYI